VLQHVAGNVAHHETRQIAILLHSETTLLDKVYGFFAALARHIVPGMQLVVLARPHQQPPACRLVDKVEKNPLRVYILNDKVVDSVRAQTQHALHAVAKPRERCLCGALLLAAVPVERVGFVLRSIQRIVLDDRRCRAQRA
jgi:hypothetical protein